MRPLSAAAFGVLASTAAWTVVLAINADLSPVAVVLIALSLWPATVASLSGMLLARAHWARRLGLAVTVAHGLAAVFTTPDVWWGIAVVLTALTAISIGGPWLDGIVRSRPSAAGPPARVVLIALVLLGVPFGIGVAGGDTGAAIALSLFALVVAYWFIRAMPGALIVVRVIFPLVALVLAYFVGWPAGVMPAAVAVAVAVMAWHPTVRNSIHPLVSSGSRVRIPPELAPTDVLDAAQIDDRGRRL